MQNKQEGKKHKDNVSWGDVLQDDVLVWLPHALFRYSHKLNITFEEIGFIAQCFSFRGPEGIHPSEETLAYRGGYSSRNPISRLWQSLKKKGFVNFPPSEERRQKDGTYSSRYYDFSPLRKKLIKLVKNDPESAYNKNPNRVDDYQHGGYQRGTYQQGTRQHKKRKEK